MTEFPLPIAKALTDPGRLRVMLGLPTRDEVKTDFALALCQLCVHSCLVIQIETANSRSCYIQVNRNDIVKEALQRGCEWLLQIDADMEFPPDGLIRLLRHQVDIVGGTYARRSPPYQLMGATLDRAQALPMEGLVEMTHIPTGFLLTRMEVFRKMEPPWFWVTHHADGSVHLGDDYYFCEKARAAGFKILCDTGLTAELKHHADIGLAPPQTAFPGAAAR